MATAPPVPLTSRRGSTNGISLLMRNDREAQQAAFGANGTIFGIVHKTSTAQAAITWRLWKKAKSGKPEDRVEVTSHAMLDIWNAPNDFYTGAEFRESIQQHMDLTGEWWWLVERSSLMRGVVIGLWPIRPDRMHPLPSIDKFIAGYMYVSPDGEKIPLALDEVIQTKMPNPLDPYRGLGPVQSILVYADSAKYSAEWNRTFFLNSAEPGGLIEVEKRLSDDEFNEMTTRWREQHQGISAAHRVAIIEQGKWVDRKFSQKDMQFAELHTLSRDSIMEAFGFPKSMLGIVENVNRANAETGKEIFDENLTIPRADRMRDTLNFRLKPHFPNTDNLEWDYDNPKGDNHAEINAERESKSTAASTLTLAGYEPAGVLDAVGLPAIPWVGVPQSGAGPTGMTPPEPAPTEGGGSPGSKRDDEGQYGGAGDGQDGEVPGPPVAGSWRRVQLPRAAITGPDDVDLGPVQDEWLAALALLLAHWGTVATAWYADLIAQVRTAVERDDLTALSGLSVDTSAGATQLLDAMVKLGALAGTQVQHEAERQGVDGVRPTAPDRDELDAIATVTAGLLGAGAAFTAANAALTAWGPGVLAQAVADAVAAHLNALTDAQPRAQLGRALTGAQNAGRLATILEGPEAAVYSSEVNDLNTCAPCRAIDGKWLGNVSNSGELSQGVRDTYPSSGYVGCQGGPKCRGTIVAIWRQETV